MTTTSVATEERMSAVAERFCRRFSLDEIQLATDDFSEAHLIGEGGFGKVYKGQIVDGEEAVAVAMKRLAPNSTQGEGEFLNEIETLSKLRHVNLVSLIGYCNENGEMILVYEYIAHGTLADHLYKLSRSSDSDESSSLTWKQRLNICIGAGRGLDYLHTGASIIHRDVKSTNILLDEDFRAKVSDFGLAKHLSTSSSNSYVSTIIRGSFGYLDPSYFSTSRLTQKSDTYAFGVVLLEVLCGRPALDSRLPADEMNLAIWAVKKIKKGKAKQIVASNLRDEISADCLKIFVGIAKRCLNHEPKKRPTMAQVVVQLECALEKQNRKASRFLPFLNRVKPSGSRGTGSTQKDQKQGDANMLHVDVPAIPILELQRITRNFSSVCLRTRTEGNIYYRGTLKSGQDAVIKNLWRDRQQEEEFLEQVSIVSSLKHENVAQLLGYCVDGCKQYLVYEYAPYGSLYDLLKDIGRIVSEPVEPLSWAQRVKIAVGAAKGLEYIHEKGNIHCNIKSSNILVYNDEDVKLTDFGLSTRSKENIHIEYHPSFLKRALEYHAPEYISHGELSWRGDVYSFGLVLLQLLAGRQLYDFTRPRGQQLLRIWARPKLNKRDVWQIVDPRLNGDYPPKAVAKMAEIAALCVHYQAALRPDMSIVVRALHPLLSASSTTERRNL